MKFLLQTAILAIAFGASSAHADHRDYQGVTLYAHFADGYESVHHKRHYRTHKRHHRKYRRNYRNRHYNRNYNFHIYPNYNKRYYRNDRHYRRHYRNHRRHYRNDYCRYDGVKWLAGAVVASELLHHALDNPQDDYHEHYHYHSEHHDNDHEPAEIVEGNHEQHYRSYHAARYNGS
ncbi:hypothetical protein KFE80_02465 [bacterium SCSIO 12696]|nr:hypothetical protein KFE80_02465 [bacterium SCSIO 12696]